jgi:hypothetical protein
MEKYTCKDCLRRNKCKHYNPEKLTQVDSNKYCNRFISKKEAQFWHEVFSEPIGTCYEPEKKTPEQVQLEIDEAAQTEIYL